MGGREGLTSGLAVFRRSCTRTVESNEAESISVPSSEKSSWLMAVAWASAISPAAAPALRSVMTMRLSFPALPNSFSAIHLTHLTTPERRRDGRRERECVSQQRKKRGKPKGIEPNLPPQCKLLSPPVLMESGSRWLIPTQQSLLPVKIVVALASMFKIPFEWGAQEHTDSGA